MTEPINNEENIKWSQLQGNKFNKALHPAMLSDHGYRTTIKATLIGHSKGNTQYAMVFYDKNYVIAWLVSRLIKPLQNSGLEGINELVKKAWELAHSPKTFGSEQLVMQKKKDEQI